mmetsp:Transcript_37409/g.80788  ORF Transcript_37409/g.80788 Transcript_37409/m.80788 type:complete len:766 (+) Transcript_37409:162-2459(+)
MVTGEALDRDRGLRQRIGSLRGTLVSARGGNNSSQGSAAAGTSGGRHRRRHALDGGAARDERLSALLELGERLSGLARVKHLGAEWYNPLHPDPEVDVDGEADGVAEEDADVFVPRNPSEEALLALLLFLEEERARVGSKPAGAAASGAVRGIRSALVPLLISSGRVRAAASFLSGAENASGLHEGVGNTYRRWLMLSHANLACRLPGRAVRVAQSLLNNYFANDTAQSMTDFVVTSSSSDDSGESLLEDKRRAHLQLVTKELNNSFSGLVLGSQAAQGRLLTGNGLSSDSLPTASSSPLASGGAGEGPPTTAGTSPQSFATVEDSGSGSHGAGSDPGATPFHEANEDEEDEDDDEDVFHRPSAAHQVHMLLLACRAKLDEHRMNMRRHVFNGGVDAAVATGWAEKAMKLSRGNPDLALLHETCILAYSGCILETVSRGHQGNPACSPPREVHDRALLEAETQLAKVVSNKNSKSVNPIAAYLLALVYVRRHKRKEAIELLSANQSTNSCVQIFMNSLLAVLYSTEKNTSRGFTILEKMLVELEMQRLDSSQVFMARRCFLHRVQLRFAIHKRGATTIFQRGRHGEHKDLIEALMESGMNRLASLLSADLSLHFAYAQQLPKARSFAEEAIKTDPKCPLAHHAMGVVHEIIPEYGPALGKYEDAMAVCPQYGPSALASALIWEYQMDDYTWHARDLCEDALKWNLQDYEALLALGRLKEQLGHERESKELNDEGLKYVGEMPCIPYYEFPIIIWEDDISLDCFSF